MSTESNRYMQAEDNLLNSPNDTVYSVLGILNKVQQLGDKYVLMGELRADLLDVTPHSELDMKNLSNHTIDPASSQFSDPTEFYGIINNCNYFLAHADTNMTIRNQKVFLREYNVVKTIRAWAYYQLVVNYGKVQYITEPILSIDDLGKSYPIMDMDMMLNTFIPELEQLNPKTNVDLPAYGTIGSAASKYLFINTRFLLGDLYLWRAAVTQNQSDYEKAADYYADLIDKESYVVSANRVRWYDDKFEDIDDTWTNLFDNAQNNSELISIMRLSKSSLEGTVSKLGRMSFQEKELKIADNLKTLSEEQTYALVEGNNPVKYTTGDLRLRALTPVDMTNGVIVGASDDEIEERQMIMKYRKNNIFLYRRTLLYLRYAEALNRTGRPSMAYAVLKYGLKDDVLRNKDRVNPTEVTDSLPFIAVFKQEKFENNRGIHDKGSGNTAANIAFEIPDYTRFATFEDIEGNDSIGVTIDPIELAEAKMDSIKFVENAIVDELALETGLEGNRFQDLMRISLHKEDPSFLANKVAEKHPANKQHFINLLSDPNKWYIPLRP